MGKLSVERIDRDRNYYPSAPLWDCSVTLTGTMQAPSDKRAGELFLESIESDGIGDFCNGEVKVSKKEVEK